MKRIPILLLLLLIFSCKENNTESRTTDSPSATKNKDETLDYSQTDKDSAIELTEDDLKDKLNISNIDEIKLHN